MKIILSGYYRTEKIFPAVKYLLSKYLPNDFEFILVNNNEDVKDWSKNMKNFLETLSDKLIIMGDGDFLISKKMDKNLYKKLFNQVRGDVVCARLCYSSFYNEDEYTIEDGIMTLNSNAPYSAVLQYCIWDREFLISLLSQTTDPWNFEEEGSKILNQSGKKVIGSMDGALSYYELGAFTHEQDGDKIRVNGLSDEDVNYLIENNLLNKEDIYRT